MVVQRSVRQDHGFLPHASWSRGSPTCDLCRLSEKKALGRHFGWSYFHSAGRDRDDRSELVICPLRQAPSGYERSLCSQARCARHYRSGHHQTWQRCDPEFFPRSSVDRRVCGDAIRRD